MKTISCHVRGYKGQGFGSGFIRRFTFGEYSHVSFVFDLGHKVEEVESIQGKGLIAHPPITDKAFDEFFVPLSYEQIVEAHSIACSLIGAKYDWRGVINFVRRKKTHNPDKWFCSELVAFVLHKVGYDVSRREPYRETPSSVCESLRLED
jgi:uncharacterized protein YycO